ncbi:MAG: hypothetical protein ACJ8OJ_03360 [Povalibacter sp.]
MQKLTKGQIGILLVVYVALLAAWFHQISESSIHDDALGTLIPAVNLVHDGVYSLDDEPPLAPTMYREPVPILLTSIAVVVVDAIMGPAELPAYMSGERARLIKFQNVLWLTLLCTAAFLATLYFTSSFPLATGTAVLSYLAFLYPAVRDVGVDSLYTEMPAAGLLLLSSWLLASSISGRNWPRLVAAGVCFGLLSLTKAMALPVFLGTLIVVVLYRAVRPAGTELRTTLAQTAVLLVSCAIVVAPWIYRNWTVFQSTQISERGGLSVYMRALYNEVSPTEYRGLFYIWAPSPIRTPVGRILGFSSRDLKPGGALMRLTADEDARYAKSDLQAQRDGRPDRAVSLVAKARAERVKVRNEVRVAGYGHRTNVVADDLMKDRGMAMMKEQPGKTIAGAVTGLWRGAILILPLLAWAVLHAWRHRREDVLIFCVPALGFTFLLSMFSVFEPRYSGPMTPLAFVAAAVAASGFARYRRNSALLAPKQERPSTKGRPDRFVEQLESAPPAMR